jgi:hypothetical protein
MGCMVAAWAISMSLGTGDLRTIELNASSFGLHFRASRYTEPDIRAREAGTLCGILLARHKSGQFRTPMVRRDEGEARERSGRAAPDCPA